MGFIDKAGKGIVQQGRYYEPDSEWNSKHISRGTEYKGTFRLLEGYHTKTLLINPSLGGTIHIISAVKGTDIDRGTYYTAHVGAGSYVTKSWTEAMMYGLVRFHATGTSNTGKGTLTVSWGRQA